MFSIPFNETKHLDIYQTNIRHSIHKIVNLNINHANIWNSIQNNTHLKH